MRLQLQQQMKRGGLGGGRGGRGGLGAAGAVGRGRGAAVGGSPAVATAAAVEEAPTGGAGSKRPRADAFFASSPAGTGSPAAAVSTASGAAAGQEGGGEGQADGGSEKRRVVNLNAKKK